MNRLALASFGAIYLLSVSAAGQEVSSIQIFTEPPGVHYFVDGQRYTQPSSFLWQKGTKHVVNIANPVQDRPASGVCEEAGSTATQYDAHCTSRFGFSGWETNVGSLGASTTQIITADPAVTFVKGLFTVQYKVNIATYTNPNPGTAASCSANTAPGPRPTGAGPGIVVVGGTCVPYATALWLAQGTYPVQAFPYEGYIFRGFSTDGGVSSSFLSQITVGGPTTIQPMFEPAKRVRLYTSPPELQLRIDRTLVPTINPQAILLKYPMPGWFDWARGSSHILGAVSPQTSLDGKTWVFDSWSDGGGQDMLYNVGEEVNTVTELTARFVRGASVSVVTHPQGLKVKVDGRDNAPVYTFVWKVGAKVTLAAPAEQLDSKGRKYTFKEWSNGGAATQEITVEEAHLDGSLRLTAVYEALPQAVIQSSVPGVPISVDGVNCASPCKVDRPAGSTVNVSVPAILPVSEVTRWQFTGWNDGEAADRVVTFDRDSQTLHAAYRKANRLITIMDPPAAGTVLTEPASPDGFFTSETTVRLAIENKPGYRFRRWDGDMSGTFNGGVVNMANSRIVRAFFDRVPFVAPSGVKNAAGPTPEPGVAPGSLISIYGASLATRFEASTGSPLAQTLAGALVFVEDRVLPLVYVSPEQINAQLPSDLPPGNYTVVVRPEGASDVKGEFKVVRNAPGLFSNSIESVPYAVALHADGSPVTLDSPAKPDETITLTGTGLGPADRRTVDGFSVPATPTMNLVDPIQILVDGITLPTAWAGPLPSYVGVAGIRFKLAGVAPGRHEVKIAVNGVESNTVVLQIQ